MSFKKLKRVLFILTFIFLIPTVSFALEVPTGPCKDGDSLPACVVKLFTWGIGLGVTIAFISFAIGAVAFIFQDISPEMKNEGKDRMQKAVLGVVLLGVSFIILQTINKSLITPSLNPLTALEMPKIGPVDGVYFYTTEDCSGGSAHLAKTSVPKIGVSERWKSFRITNNDKENLVKYGVILHRTPNLEKAGECSQFFTDTDCHTLEQNNINYNGAADVVQIYQEPDETGNGVSFYSATWGENMRDTSGFHDIAPEEITASTKVVSAASMNFFWAGTKISETYKRRCPNFQSCPGSMDVKGDYFIAMYDTNKKYCQTFVDKVVNFNAEDSLAQQGTASGQLQTGLGLMEQVIKGMQDTLNELNNFNTASDTIPNRELLDDVKRQLKIQQLTLDELLAQKQTLAGALQQQINALNTRAGAVSLIGDIIIVPTLGKAR